MEPSVVNEDLLAALQKKCKEVTENGCDTCCFCEKGPVASRLEPLSISLIMREATSCIALVHKCSACEQEWTCGATEERVDEATQKAVKIRMTTAEDFCAELRNIADNHDDWSDNDFRWHVIDQLKTVLFERLEGPKQELPNG